MARGHLAVRAVDTIAGWNSGCYVKLGSVAHGTFTAVEMADDCDAPVIDRWARSTQAGLRYTGHFIA